MILKKTGLNQEISRFRPVFYLTLIESFMNHLYPDDCLGKDLKEGSKQPDNKLDKSSPGSGILVIFGNLPALGKDILEIFPGLHHRIAVCVKAGIFKVVTVLFHVFPAVTVVTGAFTSFMTATAA